MSTLQSRRWPFAAGAFLVGVVTGALILGGGSDVEAQPKQEPRAG